MVDETLAERDGYLYVGKSGMGATCDGKVGRHFISRAAVLEDIFNWLREKASSRSVRLALHRQWVRSLLGCNRLLSMVRSAASSHPRWVDPLTRLSSALAVSKA